MTSARDLGQASSANDVSILGNVMIKFLDSEPQGFLLHGILFSRRVLGNALHCGAPRCCMVGLIRWDPSGTGKNGTTNSCDHPSTEKGYVHMMFLQGWVLATCTQSHRQISCKKSERFFFLMVVWIVYDLSYQE